MHSARACHTLCLWVLFTIYASSVRAKITQKQLELSWEFSWDSQLALPNPITAQCETLDIQWQRGSTLTGPDGVAPYSIQLFSSNEIAPLVIDAGPGLNFSLQIPFGPSTQYQICMYDSNGATGGCQAIYTVYPTVDLATGQAPTCTNVTFPEPLAVDLTQGGQPLSKYGFINQCSELVVTPRAGKPPFVMTIASALRPPINITSTTMDPIPWTVALDWATPFFLSLEDSTGQTWTNGPIHAGGPGQTTDCLAPRSKKRDAGVIAGSIFGGIALGILTAIMGRWMVTRSFARKRTILPMAFRQYKTEELPPPPSMTAMDADPPLPAMVAIPPISLATGGGSHEASLASTIQDGSPGVAAKRNSTNPRATRKMSRDISSVLTKRPVEADAQTVAGLSIRHHAADTDVVSVIGAAPSLASSLGSTPDTDAEWRATAAGTIYLMHSDGGVVELPPSYASERGGEKAAR